MTGPLWVALALVALSVVFLVVGFVDLLVRDEPENASVAFGCALIAGVGGSVLALLVSGS